MVRAAQGSSWGTLDHPLGWLACFGAASSVLTAGAIGQNVLANAALVSATRTITEFS